MADCMVDSWVDLWFVMFPCLTQTWLPLGIVCEAAPTTQEQCWRFLICWKIRMPASLNGGCGRVDARVVGLLGVTGRRLSQKGRQRRVRHRMALVERPWVIAKAGYGYRSIARSYCVEQPPPMTWQPETSQSISPVPGELTVPALASQNITRMWASSTSTKSFYCPSGISDLK